MSRSLRDVLTMTSLAFLPGLFFAVAGLLLSWFGVRETRSFTAAESALLQRDQPGKDAAQLSFRSVFFRTSWGDKRHEGNNGGGRGSEHVRF